MDRVYFTWSRFGRGYEVSSKGDDRFSALYARMADGRTLEAHYQCDTKGWCPGGSDWRAGKGKPPKDPSLTPDQVWRAYFGLWREWAYAHPALMEALRHHAGRDEYRHNLTDLYASTNVSQARALASLLNQVPSFYRVSLRASLETQADGRFQ